MDTTEEHSPEQLRQRGHANLRKLQSRWRGKRVRRLDELRHAVKELCAAEFEATWGHTFEGNQHRLRGRVEHFERTLRNEREARKLHHELRELARQGIDVARRLEDFSQQERLEGGAISAHLHQIVLPWLQEFAPAITPLAALANLPSVSPQELDPHPWDLLQWNHTTAAEMGRTALVLAHGPGGFPLGSQTLTARQLAVLSLLLETGWKEDTRLRQSCQRGAVPADVIEEEVRRMRPILARQAKQFPAK